MTKQEEYAEAAMAVYNAQLLIKDIGSDTDTVQQVVLEYLDNAERLLTDLANGQDQQARVAMVLSSDIEARSILRECIEAMRGANPNARQRAAIQAAEEFIGRSR